MWRSAYWLPVAILAGGCQSAPASRLRADAVGMAIWGAERVDGTAIIGRSEMACQAKKPCFVLPVPGVDETGVVRQKPACSAYPQVVPAVVGPRWWASFRRPCIRASGTLQRSQEECRPAA